VSENINKTIAQDFHFLSFFNEQTPKTHLIHLIILFNIVMNSQRYLKKLLASVLSEIALSRHHHCHRQRYSKTASALSLTALSQIYIDSAAVFSRV
jgi:hypothetical protein